MKQNKPVIMLTVLGISICILLVLISTGLRLVAILNAPDEKNILPTINYEIGENDSNLEKLWSRSGIFVDLYMYSGGSQIVAAREAVVIDGRSTQTGKYQVFALSALNGSLLWDLPEHTSSLFATSSAVYMGFTSHIKAYDLPTGRLIWSSEELPARNVSYLLVVDNLIHAHSQVAHLLQADTGDLIANLPEYPSKTTLNEWNINTSPEYFNRFDDITLTKDTKFVRGVAEFRGDGVRAIDRETEKILWEIQDGVISNVAATETTLYLITRDRKLLGLDVRGGQVISSIQFELKPSTTSDTRRSTGGYYVAVDRNAGFVYAYFGDSEQLFAFKIVDSSAD